MLFSTQINLQKFLPVLSKSIILEDSIILLPPIQITCRRFNEPRNLDQRE
jgi:hypothetical protein